MTTKSNVYHYFSYVIYALVFFCSIGLYSVSMVRESGSTDYLIPLIIRYGIVIAGIAILILGYRTAFNYIPDKFKTFNIPVISKLIEAGILVSVIIVTVLLNLVNWVSLWGTEFSSEYLDFALGNGSSLSNTTMLAYMYGYICKGLVNIHASAYPIIVFNFVLYIGVIVFTYYICKIALRIRYGILAVLLLAFMPAFTKLILNINPEVFYLFLITAYIFALVKICKLNKTGKIEENYCIVFFILLGLASGFIASLDMFGIVLLLITLPSLLLIVNNDAWLKVQKNWFQSLVYFAAFLVGCFASLYLINVNGLVNFENIMNYVYSFIPNGLNVDIFIPMAGRQEGIAIIIFAGISIFAFLRNDKDNGLYYVLFVDIAAILSFVKFNVNTYELIVNYAWVMLAVIGLFSLPSFVLSAQENEQARVKKKEKENKKFHKEQEKFLSKNAGSVISLAPNTDAGTPVKTEEPKVSLNNTEVKMEPVENKKSDDIDKDIKPKKDKNDKKNNDFVLNLDNNESKSEEQEMVKTVSVVETPNKEAVTAIEEKLAPVSLEPVKVETVYAGNDDRSKILPSRRDYKTAHVYKSDEEKTLHDENVNKPVSNHQNAELKEKPAFIKNVLPTPKPHVAKEMSYDYELKDNELDYDITDIKGHEYYDI